MKLKDDESIPEVIKRKLQNQKIEVRLVNNKEIKLGSQITAFPKIINTKKQLNASLEIINYSTLDNEPCISKHGRLLSEVFKITVTDNKGMEMERNHYNITYEIRCTNLDKFCYPMVCNLNEWSLLEQFEIDNDCIKINNCNWNMIIIVQEPPSEIIKISRNGGLLYSKLDPLMSLRISKGIFKEEVECKIHVCDMSLQHLDNLRYIYDDQLSPFLNLSQMLDIEIVNSNNKVPFRRAISIKLRLPDWVIAILNEQESDSKNIIRDQKKEKIGFYLMEKIDDIWNFVESNMKFTNNFVEFDVKHLGSYLFVECRENREIRLCPNLTLVENLMCSEPGIILTFLWTKTKDWFLWLEIVPISNIKETRTKMESMGFIFIEQYHETIKADQGQSKRTSQYHRKSSKAETVIQRKTFELMENIQFKLSLAGELELCSNTNDNVDDTVSGMKTADETEETVADDNLDFDDFDKIGTKRNKQMPEEKESLPKVRSDLSYHKNTRHSNCIVISVTPIKRDFAKWETLVLDKIEKRSVYRNSKTFKQIETQSQYSENTNIQNDIDDGLIQPSSEDSKNATRPSKGDKEFLFFSELCLETLNSVPLIHIPKQIFKFYISVDSMKEYFQIKTKEEKEKIELENELLKQQLKHNKEIAEKMAEERKRTEIEDKPKQLDLNHLYGMAKPKYIHKVIEKEPKVISRRSFLALSSIVRQGLKLAVYLSIPDNVIAGIGFDALSQMTINGTNNTTYKVLLLWKKMILLNKTKEKEYVEQLIYSLNAIGYERVGQLVYNRWIKQQEITMVDCQRCLLQNNY